ncbi:unnamed protein product [Soboliphyme baturini]|uniref:Chitin-binding type-2 domain-containing protein n=1 Tax=Soboliphyme baturini TaxID=241478 RepID=A0A183J7V4_9BILA|nr:unnamed protein product [Soboliphyme baturini]
MFSGTLTACCTESCRRPSPGPNCTFLPDGDYPAGYCQMDYYQCLEGERIFRLCPLGYVFEFENRHCAPFVKVGYCTSSKFGDASMGISAKFEIPSCNYLVDGSHEIGQCQQAYLVCFNGQGHLQYCPTNHVFNSVMQQCIQIENLLECIMSTPGTSTTGRLTPATYPAAIKSTLPFPTGTAPVSKSGASATAVYNPFLTTPRAENTAVSTASIMDLILSTSPASAVPSYAVTVIPGVTTGKSSPT